jgi:hypothetical protein
MSKIGIQDSGHFVHDMQANDSLDRYIFEMDWQTSISGASFFDYSRRQGLRPHDHLDFNLFTAFKHSRKPEFTFVESLIPTFTGAASLRSFVDNMKPGASELPSW